MPRSAKWLAGMLIVGAVCVLAARLLGGDPYAGVVHEENVVYATAAGQELRLDLARPKAGPGPFPLVVFIHGGGWQWGEKAEYQSALPNLARNGFVCAAIDYRLTPEHRFPAQLEDVRAAIAFLCESAERYQINPDRIALFGGSAGGHLALLAGFTSPADNNAPHVRAIVSFAGPTDLTKLYLTVRGKDLVADFLGTKDRAANVAMEASPICHVRRDVPPVITIHGDKDELVPVSQGIALHEALKTADAIEELIVIPGGGHDSKSWRGDERDRAYKRAFEFMIEHLKR